VDALEQIEPSVVGEPEVQHDRIGGVLPQGFQPLACSTRLLYFDGGQILLDDGA